MDLSVIKVGGSLAIQPDKLQVLCQKLLELSKQHCLVVVPGGGEFADTVRRLDDRFHLSKEASHRMAILGMDQYGLLLADLMADVVVVNGLGEAEKALERGKLTIFLPSTLLFSENLLENSWDITSDSIALYVAHQLHANRVLLATDVDGVYTNDPKKDRNANLIRNISAEELLAFRHRTSVDKALPRLLLQWRINCYVVNGFFPDRIGAILDGGTPLDTLISAKPCNA